MITNRPMSCAYLDDGEKIFVSLVGDHGQCGLDVIDDGLWVGLARVTERLRFDKDVAETSPAWHAVHRHHLRAQPQTNDGNCQTYSYDTRVFINANKKNTISRFLQLFCAENQKLNMQIIRNVLSRILINSFIRL